MIDHSTGKECPLMWTVKGSDSVSFARDPGANEGADEPERRGHDEPAAGPAGNRLADGTADGRDDDEENEPRQCVRHDRWSLSSRTGGGLRLQNRPDSSKMTSTNKTRPSPPLG